MTIKNSATSLAICLLVFLLPVSKLFSQGATLRGSVLDSATGNMLEGATVSLLRVPDSGLIRATRSLKSGFALRKVAAGRYWVSATFTGYATMVQGLEVQQGDTTKMPPFRMHPAGTELMRVVVRLSIPPVISKSDTLDYQAGAFRTRPNASVEELLKKLPGVQVASDGSVTVDGRKVDKFYIDGKEIPLSDPRALTQNLTADMISGIETFDRRSDDSRFTGLRDNDGAKAINLQLKKAWQSSLAGKAFAGYGLPGFYGAGGNALFFDPATRAILSLGQNNSNDLVGPNPPGQFIPGGTGSHTRTGLNGNRTFSPRLSTSWQYGLDDQDLANQSTTQRQAFTGDSSLLSQRNAASRNRARAQNASFYLQYRPDSMTELTVSPQLSLNTGVNNSMDSQQVVVQKEGRQYLSGTSVTQNNTESRQSAIGGDLSLRHRFKKKGESIRFHISAGWQPGTTGGHLKANTIGYDSAANVDFAQVLDQQSTQHTTAGNIGTGLGYTWPLNAKLILDATYDFRESNQHKDQRTFNYDPLTGKYDEPDSLTTNIFSNILVTHNLGVGINRSANKFRYQAGLSVQYSDQQNRNASASGQDFSQRLYNWFPRAGFFYNISRQQQLNLNYSGNTQQAGIERLQPVPDFSNPLLIKKGNPGLKPEFDHSVNLGYRRFSPDRMQSLQLVLSLSLAQNKFTQSVTLLPAGAEQLQYVNASGTYSENVAVSYNFPFDKGKKGNCRIGTNVSSGRSIGFLNGDPNVQHTVAVNPGININYSPFERLLVESNAGITFNRTSYSLGPLQTSQLSQKYTLGLSYELPTGLLVTTDLFIQVTGAEGSLRGQTVSLWNANLSRRIFPKKSAEVRLSAFDILRANKGFYATSGDNYIETGKALVMSQLIFVSFIYYFKIALSAGAGQS